MLRYVLCWLHTAITAPSTSTVGPEHKYDLVGDTFQRHKAEITASLEPVEKQLGVVSKALEQFDLRLHELDDLQVAIKDNIQRQI